MDTIHTRHYAPDVWKAHRDEELQEFITETTKRFMSDAYHMALSALPQHERERMLNDITTYVQDAQKELDSRNANR